MSDEQRVRTMAGWIGVEISKSRVRTPGKVGYGLYRVRGSAGRPETSGRIHHRMREAEPAEWTPYAYTLDEIEQNVRRAIEAGRPSGPAALGPLMTPVMMLGHEIVPSVAIPTRWTSAYRGRRDLGLDAELADLERTDRAVGRRLSRTSGRGAELVRKARDPGVGGVQPYRGPGSLFCERCAMGDSCPAHDPVEPVAVRPEYAAELDALVVLLDAGLVEMSHVEGCVCDVAGRRFTAACVRETMTPRQRQRAENAVFQAEHLERRAHGLKARYRTKGARNAISRDSD